jgi:putative SOS response-associated peptidase YedK
MDLRSMCGRFTLRTPLKTVALLFDLSEDAVDAAAGRSPRFNIAPSQEIAAVRHRVAGNPRELVWLRWGLVPHWADAPDTAAPMINARAETLTSRPAFREAFAERRCLIPADGFFEWKRTAGRRQPYYIRLADEQPFALAGLCEHWQRGSTQLESCTIITTDANELLRPIHHRMPVILPRERFDA